MNTYQHHIGQLFLLGNIMGFDGPTPMLEDCNGDMVIDYLTDWMVRLYRDGRIDAKDLRHYLDILVGTYPEIRQCLYSWLQAEH